MRVFFRAFYCFLLIFPSFSQAQQESVNKEVESRVEARWKAIASHNFGKAYDYETPTYKAVFTRDLYVNQYGHTVAWVLTDAQVIEYNSHTNIVTVKVKINTTSINSEKTDKVSKKPVNIEIREKWLKIDGHWWHGSSE